MEVVDDGLAFDVGEERFKCKTLVNLAGHWVVDLAATSFIDRPHGGFLHDDRGDAGRWQPAP
ncbi:MAG: hypothetical protein OEN22_02195 [Gammaproteobacteria bacterium]|nr:hypothetical protein [Gammaproteobacteria bacterium]